MADRLYECQEPGCTTMPFGSRDSLRKHSSVHRPRVRCYLCGELYKNEGLHYRNHHPGETPPIGPRITSEEWNRQQERKEWEAERDDLLAKLKNERRLKKQYFEKAKQVPALKKRIQQLENERRHLGIHD